MKMPVKQIAAKVGVHISTVYREVKRGVYIKKEGWRDRYGYEKRYRYKETYSPDIAEKRYREFLAEKGAPLKIGNDYALADYIENKIIKDKYSPDAVLGEIRRKGISFKTSICTATLYCYIEKGLFRELSLKHLPEKGKKKKRRQRKISVARMPKGTSIEKRPKEIQKRTEFGHWEMDCVCGSTKNVLLVLTERMTRKEIIIPMPNQKAINVVSALNMLEHKYGKMFERIFKTITVDNGSEFSAYNDMQKSIYRKRKKPRTAIYYCHPYCSSERGINERMNREIRRKIPKGSNLAKFSKEEIQEVEHWLNNYPRKILKYATADELFNEQITKIT